jgi:hypothetical protein
LPFATGLSRSTLPQKDVGDSVAAAAFSGGSDSGAGVGGTDEELIFMCLSYLE